MSLANTLKGLIGKGKQAAADHKPQVESAIEKASRIADQRTKGKYTDKIEKGKTAAKRAIPDSGQRPGDQRPGDQFPGDQRP
ncbi:MAG: antitoxin [Aldersonia sp.]|nr:antitoxin [Aldersonia sp.]